jgi:uncharacterized protein involved in response to NO
MRRAHAVLLSKECAMHRRPSLLGANAPLYRLGFGPFHLPGAAFAAPGMAALGYAGTSNVLPLPGAGAMTGMIGAMITRTALGHTGRLLRAGGVERLMYALLPAGVLARLAANGVADDGRIRWLRLPAARWSPASLLYVCRYAPFLTRPRADGRPG